MSSAPQNRAAVLTAPNTPLEVKDVPAPTPGPNQLTIRTHAVAFNPVDTVMHATGYMINSFPAVIGCDAAGEVTAVSDEAAKMGFKVGD